MNDDKKKKETFFKEKDVGILRERLVWASKRLPPQYASEIHKSLLHFAESVSKYCQCENTVYVKNEEKWACLNCGKRHDVDKPKLEVAK